MPQNNVEAANKLVTTEVRSSTDDNVISFEKFSQDLTKIWSDDDDDI